MFYLSNYSSPLGDITVVSNATKITALQFVGSKYYDDFIPPEHENSPDDIIIQAFEWLDIYFSGKNPDFTPPIFYRSTNFRMTVWNILKTVPYGSTVTYKQIAENIAHKRSIPSMSAQAVGFAVGENPIHLIIPCHRVFRNG
ncbi:MAG: methylated-DNA--[protein]-cysteine S-methyltransferase [Clostridiales bacterium]|nr:methylated-DNA--[protein]-cysteine S-methyltransferase [Clostridiales bacterium]